MILDILLVVIIALVIALAAAEGLARSLVMLIGFYLLSMLLGMLIVGFNVAQVLANAVLRSIGGPQSPFFYQGFIFLALLIPGFILLLILGHIALEDATIKGLGWIDNLLGTLVGVALALVFAAVICNTWGVIVAQQWRPFNTWIALRLAYDTSVLRPYMMNILRFYRGLLFPFSVSGYPIFYVPQG